MIGLMSGTRAIAGSGLALLFADKLDNSQRKAVGWALLGVGLLTTIPLALLLFGGLGKAERTENPLAAMLKFHKK